MPTFLPDVRDALRGLKYARGFSLMAIGTLGLGIAAATTVFSLIDAVLLRPLPYTAPDRPARAARCAGGSALRA